MPSLLQNGFLGAWMKGALESLYYIFIEISFFQVIYTTSFNLVMALYTYK